MAVLNVPFALPELGQAEIDEITAVIHSGWLTTASRCAQFEKEFAEYIGAKHALAVNSATAALHLGLEALEIGAGDKVLVPTFTFTATAEVVRYLDADPTFVDCDPESFCISIDEIEKIIAQKSEGRPKAVIPVHFGGHPCRLDPISRLAERNNFKVMEDAAHALPTRHSGRLIGNFGDVTCFSFYANKTITTGEGGMLCTDDDEIARRVRIMRLHGIDRDVWNRFSTGAAWEYDVVAPGFKYNMSDLCAALGIHQLKKVDFFREKRQRVAEAYYENLKDIPGLILPRISCAMEDHSWYLFNVMIERKETKSGIDRNKFIGEMTKRKIGTSVHYKPLHRMTYYKTRYRLENDMFPNAEWVFERCVSLPIYPSMTNSQIEYVIENIRDIVS
jgi:dTDP-4-amino-4,6-dideoxygalactose transaminase